MSFWSSLDQPWGQVTRMSWPSVSIGAGQASKRRLLIDLITLCRPFHLPTLLFACSGALLQE